MARKNEEQKEVIQSVTSSFKAGTNKFAMKPRLRRVPLRVTVGKNIKCYRSKLSCCVKN